MALPVCLDLRGRRVVAIGGGPVTERRVRAFVDEGANVVVVAPEITSGLHKILGSGNHRWLARAYAGPADLIGAHLVHTATGDPGVDAAVVAAAEAAHCWAINASAGSHSPVAMSARATLDLPDGPVTLAVNASIDPRRAMAIRDALVAHLLSGAVALQRHRPAGAGQRSGPFTRRRRSSPPPIDLAS